MHARGACAKPDDDSTKEKEEDERQWVPWSLLFVTKIVEIANKEMEALLDALDEKFGPSCEDDDEEDGTSK